MPDVEHIIYAYLSSFYSLILEIAWHLLQTGGCAAQDAAFLEPAYSFPGTIIKYLRPCRRYCCSWWTEDRRYWRFFRSAHLANFYGNLDDSSNRNEVRMYNFNYSCCSKRACLIEGMDEGSFSYANENSLPVYGFELHQLVAIHSISNTFTAALDDAISVQGEPFLLQHALHDWAFCTFFSIK